MMTLPLFFSIFWIVGIVWVICYWCSENPCNNNRKMTFNVNSDTRSSTMSIDSSDVSDNDECLKRNRKGFKYETKTRWPSKTSINEL